jgi:hypothetical protein
MQQSNRNPIITSYTSGEVSVLLVGLPITLAIDPHGGQLQQAAPSVSLHLGGVFGALPKTLIVDP